MSGNRLTIQATKDISISINSNSSQLNIDKKKSLYSINWFDTKRAWLYKLYNMLAIRSVLKIGGRPFLKAHCNNLIQGEEQFNRKVLLIVRYPNPASFLKLMSNKYFQLISVFRNSSVKDFTFGFASKTSDRKWEKKKDSHFYLFHHYQINSKEEFNVAGILKNELEQKSIEILFSGEVNQYLSVKKGAKDEVKVPNLIDGLIIYQSQDKELLKQAVLSEKYQSLIDLKLKVSSLVELLREF